MPSQETNIARRGPGTFSGGRGTFADYARRQPYRSAVLVAEVGVDMARFPTAGHLISWARLCPGLHESAGKRFSTRVRKGAPWLKTTLVQAAWAVADCERLVEEMIDRTDLGLSTEVPLLHCQFALNDVKDVLKGAKVSPRLYNQVPQDMTNLGVKLVAADGASNREDKKKRLQEIIAKLQPVQRSIATTPELP